MEAASLPCLRDKGKGRARSPPMGLYQEEAHFDHSEAKSSLAAYPDAEAATTTSASSTPSCSSSGGRFRGSQSSASAESECIQTPHSNSCDAETVLSYPRHSNEASSPSTGMMAALAVPWSCSSKEGGDTSSSNAGIHPHDPFAFGLEGAEQSAYSGDERRIASIGLRRRPYQSGYSPLPSPSCRESVMTTIDRASIFAGLEPTVQDTATTAQVSEMMPSSKRSFEEAIPALLTPTRGRSSRHSQARDYVDSRTTSRQSSSRPFTASTSHAAMLSQDSNLCSISSSSSDLQTAQRRSSNKRRRPMSREEGSFDAGMANAVSSTSTRESSKDPESREGVSAATFGDAASFQQHTSSGSQRASNARSDHLNRIPSPDATSRHRDGPFAHQQMTETADENESSFDNVGLPMGTMNLLQQWWVDTEDPQEPHSIHRRTMPLQGTDEQSSARPRHDESPGEMTSRDERSVDTASGPANARESPRGDLAQVSGTDYHDELMDVFRRLSGDSLQTDGTTRPVMPPRSSSMMRSTTQLSNVSHLAIPDEDAGTRQAGQGDRNEEGDMSNSHAESSMASRPDSYAGSTTLLPSARAAYQSRMSRSARSRPATLQTQVERFEELARRNRAIISRYADSASSQRLRHAGSPTMPGFEDHGEALQQPETEAGRTLDRQQQASRSDTASSLTESLQDASIPLWGEYFSSQRQDAESSAPNISITLDSSSTSPAEAARSRLGTRFSTNNTALVSSSWSLRRRAGGLGSAGRLRGPTRRLNEEWLNMNVGDDDSAQVEDSSSGETARRAFGRLEDEASVMSAYRRMQFPDPEASLALQTDPLGTSNQPPQLPSLRARSPLVSPFDSMDSRQSLGERQSQESDYASMATSRAGREPYLGPSLRPLTLSSRLAESQNSPYRSHRIAARTTDEVGEEQVASRRHSNVPPGSAEGNNSVSSLQSSSRPWQSLVFPEEASSRMAVTLQRHRNTAADEREDRRSDGRAHIFSPREQEVSGSSERPLDVPLPRRLAAYPDSSRHLRQRVSASLYSHRRPTLLDSNSSAVDMELPRTAHWQARNTVLRADREAESSQPRDRSSRPTSSHAEARLSSRLDRYLQELGSLNAEWRDGHQESPRSSSSTASSLHSASSGSESLFSLSRLPGGSMFAASRRSEIAMNPANYVADEEFALRDTYEGLLHLSAQIGDVRSKATPVHVIAKLPTCPYWQWSGGSCDKSKMSGNVVHSAVYGSSPSKGKARAVDDDEKRKISQPQSCSKDASCSICLESYEDADSVMSLPCHHAFHEGCVSAWLKTARSCPICRGDVCHDDGEEKSKLATSATSFHTMPWHRILPELNF